MGDVGVVEIDDWEDVWMMMIISMMIIILIIIHLFIVYI